MGASRLVYLEHTADVGFDVSAETLPELFQRAAAGMFELLLGKLQRVGGRGEPLQGEVRLIRLRADGPDLLLAAWLRELLFRYETEGVCAVQSEFRTLTEQELDAAVTCTRPQGTPLREIKGVTYHQLYVRREDHTWQARVIFDV